MSGGERRVAGIRLGEVLVLQGTPLMGLAYACEVRGDVALAPVLALLAGSLLLVAAIWQFNDWADYLADRIDPDRGLDTATRAAGREPMLPRAAALLAGGLGLLAWLPLETFLLAAGIASLGILYSSPRGGAKGVPILGSLVHLVGGVCHFLMASAAFVPIDGPALARASFFGLVFMAGHAMQEVQDHDADRLAGVRSNAVAGGRRPVFLAACAAFGLAYLVLFALCLAGLAPLPAGLVAAAVLPFHAAWSWRTASTRLGHADVRALRARYRVLFALIGLGLLAAAAREARRPLPEAPPQALGTPPPLAT